MRIQNRKFLVADFETSTESWLEKDDNTARVWLWGIYNIFEDKFEYGTNIDSFMEKVLMRRQDYNPIIYFHNLKFDGSYIINWLFNNGYKYDLHLMKEKSFDASISDMGLWYQIRVCVYKSGKQKVLITFQDSLKKIPLSVREIPKAFHYEDEEKGELDYDTYRPIGHEPTAEELDYLLHDCKLVARAMYDLERGGFVKMTGSGDAFYQWKLTLLSDRKSVV